MMHLTSLAGFKHQTNLCAERILHEIMMHRAGGHQRADRNAVGRYRAVRKNGKVEAIGDGLPGLGTNALQCLSHTSRALDLGEGDIDFLGAPAAVIHAF